MVMMGAFARRSEAWLLAGSQVVTCGVVSVIVTAFLPSPYGFQTAFAALSHWPVAGATLYLALGSTVFAFWGQATAQTKLGPTESAVLFSLEPVLAAVLSVVWLKESMTPQQVFGGACEPMWTVCAFLLILTLRDHRPEVVAGFRRGGRHRILEQTFHGLLGCWPGAGTSVHRKEGVPFSMDMVRRRSGTADRAAESRMGAAAPLGNAASAASGARFQPAAVFLL